MIKNAANLSLIENSGNLPDVSGAMQNWFQTMIFGVVVKSIVNFKNAETITQISFQGVMQPLSPEKLDLKPIAQRSWIWQQLHAEIDLILMPDEIVYYLNKTYRVMEKYDYSKYQYVEYHLVEDYEEVP